MATIAQNLQTLITNKAAIKAALKYAGMKPTDDMSTYAQLIKNVADVYYSSTSNGSVSKYTGELYVPGNVLLKSYGFIRCGCSKIEVGEGVTLIPAYCFTYNYCPLIILPSTITQINGSAFNNTYVNVKYIIKATTPPTLAGATFTAQSGKTVDIYVPDASVNAYKAAQNWSNVASKIHPMSEYSPT